MRNQASLIIEDALSKLFALSYSELEIFVVYMMLRWIGLITEGFALKQQFFIGICAILLMQRISS